MGAYVVVATHRKFVLWKKVKTPGVAPAGFLHHDFET